MSTLLNGNMVIFPTTRYRATLLCRAGYTLGFAMHLWFSNRMSLGFAAAARQVLKVCVILDFRRSASC